MEKNANYDKLRKLYYSNPAPSPSHTKVPNLRTISNKTIINATAQKETIKVEDVQLQQQDEQVVVNEIMADGELNEFKKELNKRSSDIINALYDKYGTKTYSKITQMIHNEDFSEWNELEKSLKEEMIEFNISKEPETAHEFLELLNDSKLFNDVLEEQTMQPELDEDYAYLDALVQHDYKKLRSLKEEEGSLASIFNEILQNEQCSNQNYQDDVFNKNIELIFDNSIDLDNDDWHSVADLHSQETPKLKLDEAIEYVKDNVESLTSFETSALSDKEIEQADLKAFYSETKLEMIEKVESNNKLADEMKVEKTSFIKSLFSKLSFKK
ncbi:MAG TPA: hypothetical protein DCY20_10960 [Firmicutes bacterium]|nr:hypothetical protein [Bacillota bacterium]